MSKDGEVAITLLAVAAETVFHTALMRDLMLSGNMRDVDLDRTLTVAFKLASTGEMSPEMREAVKNRMTALKLDLEHLRTNQTGDVFFMTDREDPHGLMA